MHHGRDGNPAVVKSPFWPANDPSREREREKEREQRRTGSPSLAEGTLRSRLADFHPYAAYGAGFVVLCTWPIWVVLLVLAAPLVTPCILLRFLLQVLRAADWSPLRSLKLLLAVAEHAWSTACVLPLVANVLWYYAVNAKADHVIKDVPFACCPYLNSGTRSATSSPQTTPSSTRSSTPLSGYVAQFPSRTAISPGLSITPEWCIAECRLDVYRHPPDVHMRPVIIFVYGGAWATGSKAYYARLAAILRAMGDAVVVVPDYPLFPAAGMGHMIDALYHVLRWVYGNVTRYGGDPHRLHLVGHSAGAHLATMLMLRRGLALSNDAACPIPSSCTVRRAARCSPIALLLSQPPPPTEITPVTPIDYRHCPAVTSLSVFCGVFDLMNHFSFEAQRGVDRVSSMEAATGGFWKAFSPTTMLDSLVASQPSTPTHQRSSTTGAHAIAIMKGTPPSKAPHETAPETRETNERVLPRTPPAEPSNTQQQRRDETAVLHVLPGRGGLVLEACHMPQIHIFHAVGDPVVPPSQSEGLRDALLKHGIPVPPVEPLHCGHADVVLGPVRNEINQRGLHPVVVALSKIVQAE